MYEIYQEKVKRDILIVTEGKGYDDELCYVKYGSKNYWPLEAFGDWTIAECIQIALGIWGIDMDISVKKNQIQLGNCNELVINKEFLNNYRVLYINSFLLCPDYTQNKPDRLLFLLLIDHLRCMAIIVSKIRGCNDICVKNFFLALNDSINRKIMYPIIKYFLLCDVILVDISVIIIRTMVNIELDQSI